MNKKYITVPKTKEAEEKLSLDTAQPEELLEYVFLNEEEYYNFYKTGVFELINEKCDSLIGDFESDELKEIESLQECLNILNKEIEITDSNNAKIMEEIAKLVKEAMLRGTGMYFFF